MRSEFLVTATIVALLAVGALFAVWWNRPGPLEGFEPVAERPAVPALRRAEPAAVEPLSASILFGFDRAGLGASESAKLDRLLERLGAEAVRFEAVGHADRIGSAAYNLRLSQRRADAVKAYLVERRMDPGAVRTGARGELEPASGDGCVDMGPELRRNTGLVECLQPDRRVEVSVIRGT